MYMIAVKSLAPLIVLPIALLLMRISVDTLIPPVRLRAHSTQHRVFRSKLEQNKSTEDYPNGVATP